MGHIYPSKDQLKLELLDYSLLITRHGEKLMSYRSAKKSASVAFSSILIISTACINLYGRGAVRQNGEEELPLQIEFLDPPVAMEGTIAVEINGKVSQSHSVEYIKIVDVKK